MSVIVGPEAVEERFTQVPQADQRGGSCSRNRNNYRSALC